MMIAIGPSISRPGFSLPSASGNRPSAVTVAVIRINSGIGCSRWMVNSTRGCARASPTLKDFQTFLR